MPCISLQAQSQHSASGHVSRIGINSVPIRIAGAQCTTLSTPKQSYNSAVRCLAGLTWKTEIRLAGTAQSEVDFGAEMWGMRESHAMCSDYSKSETVVAARRRQTLLTGKTEPPARPAHETESLEVDDDVGTERYWRQKLES